MNATLQFLATRQTTSNLIEPARLILQSFLATNACLLHQERALRTRLFISMALMLDLRMSTISLTGTVKSTFRWLDTTRLWRLEHSLPACTTDFGEYSLQTTSTWSLVA
jgi:hypothetical protein